MRRVVISASCRALSFFVLFVAGVLATWVVLYRVTPTFPAPGRFQPKGLALNPIGPVLVRPDWAIPVAVAIACLGIALAVIIHRGRPNWPRHPRAKPPQAGVFELPPL
jgi:hypothetical protein